MNNIDDIQAHLSQGQLVPVADAAIQVLGKPVSQATIQRWALNGRHGCKLPTVRGTNRAHLTTVGVFRAWLLLSSGVVTKAEKA